MRESGFKEGGGEGRRGRRGIGKIDHRVEKKNTFKDPLPERRSHWVTSQVATERHTSKKR